MKSGSCRRSERIRIARDLNCNPTSEKEVNKRKKRMAEAKVVGDQISLDSESKRKIEEIGSGSKMAKVPQPDTTNPAAKFQHPQCFTTLPGDPDAIEKLYRTYRGNGVRVFNTNYVYGAISNDQGSTSSHDRRYLICPEGRHSWLVASSGITWVSVQGKDSICVATKNEDVDRGRLQSYLAFLPKEDVRIRFMGTVVHEMEDPSGELRKELGEKFKQAARMTSFAAVSVTSGTVEVGEESDRKASAAIDFLEKKLENYPAFTSEETVQTAISALHRLHQEKFQATDILVVILKKGKQMVEYLSSYDIENHLEVVEHF